MSSSELSIADAMLRGFASAGIGCALVVGDQVPRVNSALCELVGAPREDALVAAIDEFVIVDHTARTSLHAFVAKWRAAPSHGTHRARTAVSFAGGSAVPVDIAIVAITSDTTLIQFHDLRERRRVEAQLVAHRDVARILNRATTIPEAFPDVLHAMAMPLGWSVGTIWIVDDSDEHLRLHARWSKDDRRFASFLASSDAQIFVRGDGLPGRVWASGQPEWIPDIATFAGFPRAGHATGAGLSSAAAFPFRVGDALAGVIECFSIERRAPDDGLLHSMAAFGDQIGHFIARARLTRQWKESDAWRVSLVESSLDAVVTIDHHGRVLEFNAAAEAMFRAPRESVIGREMAELIHPPALREQHRRGLARYLATGESRILSQRMQMRAERADGSPWSLELTVARVGDVEPPLFTGVVRDVTFDLNVVK